MSEYSSNLLQVLRRTLDQEAFPPAERRDSRRRPTGENFPERNVPPQNLDYPSFPSRSPRPPPAGFYNSSPPSRDTGIDYVEIRPRRTGFYDSSPPRSQTGINYIEIRPRHAGYYDSSPPSSQTGINYVEIRPRHAGYYDSSPPRSETGIDYVEVRPRSGFDTMPHFEYQHPHASPLGHQPALRPLSFSPFRHGPISPYDDDSSSSSSSFALSSFSDDEEEFYASAPPRGHASALGGHTGFDDFETLPPDFDYEPPRRTPHQGSRTVADFLAALPRVEVSTLPEDEKSCPICTNKYNTPSEATSTDPSVTESCVRLLCHHAIGQNCIKRWLEEGNTTCPICRTDVYSP